MNKRLPSTMMKDGSLDGSKRSTIIVRDMSASLDDVTQGQFNEILVYFFNSFLLHNNHHLTSDMYSTQTVLHSPYDLNPHPAFDRRSPMAQIQAERTSSGPILSCFRFSRHDLYLAVY